MGRMPDLSGLFFFAALGIVFFGLTVTGVSLWAAYHVVMALILYLG